MTFNSKKTITSLFVGGLLSIAYVIYALGKSAPAPDDVKSWAIAMLAFVGAGIAITIVMMVLFHIAFAIGVAIKEKMQGHEPDENVERIMNSSMIEDEREKLIERKSDRVEHAFAGFGFVGMLIALACGMSVVAALHIMLGATGGGMLVGGCVNIYYHERGV